MTHPIEDAILDTNKSDAEVFDFIVNQPDDMPDRARDGLTAEEYTKRMEAYGQELERLGELCTKKRPEVMKRLEKELVEQHECCGGCNHDCADE